MSFENETRRAKSLERFNRIKADIETEGTQAVAKIVKANEDAAWLTGEVADAMYTDAERAEVAALAASQAVQLAATLDSIATLPTVAAYLQSKGYTVTAPE